MSLEKSSFSVASRQLLTDQLYEELKKMILRGYLKPGKILTETGLANAFNTSRTPVREAIKILISEGLVIKKSNGRLEITRLSYRQALDISDLRIILESSAPKLIFQNNRFTETFVEELKKNVSYSDQLLEEEDLDGILENNFSFHTLIIDSTYNKDLIQVFDNLSFQIIRYRTTILHNTANARSSIEGHKEIIEAFLSEDIERIEDTIEGHLLRAKEKLLLRLKEMEEDQQD